MSKSKSALSELDAIFIQHPAFDDVVSEVEETLALHGTIQEAPNLYITGPSGIGKSTLLKKLRESHPRVPNTRSVKLPNGTEAICDYVPLVCIEMPSQPTVIRLARAILKELGDPLWHTGDRDALTHRVGIYVPACGVRGIVIDEAQRAVDRNGVVVGEDLAEWIKEQHNKLNISFFLLGMGRVRFLFDHDDQIDRRWDEELPMPPYDWGSQEEDEPLSRLHFIALLVAFKSASPIPFSADLDVENDDVALRFYYASRGVVGLLKKLLLRATRFAEQDKATVIAPDALKRAYDRAFRKEKQHESLINPWGRHWDGRQPPALRDHTVLLRPKKKRFSRGRKKDRRADLNNALTKN
jgi:hypothetical protein